MNGSEFMKRKSYFIILIFLIMVTFTACSSQKPRATEKGSKEGLEPQKVVENYFKYKNEKDKDKLLTTLTELYKAPNVVWGFENLDSIKILNIEEETEERIRRGYISNGRGSINGTTEDNLKVYKVKYEVKYKKDGIGPQDSGIYDWWYFVIRKDKESPWLIDDFGV